MSHDSHHSHDGDVDGTTAGGTPEKSANPPDGPRCSQGSCETGGCFVAGTSVQAELRERLTQYAAARPVSDDPEQEARWKWALAVGGVLVALLGQLADASLRRSREKERDLQARDALFALEYGG